MRPAKLHPRAGEDANVRAARWAQVTARDLMRKDVVTVADSTPLSEVERILSEHRISGAPVTDETGSIVGILSWRDLFDRYVEDDSSRPRRSPGWFHLSSEELLDEDFDSFEVPEESEDTARDVMSSDLFTVPPDAGLKEIAETMVKHRVHRVLVRGEGAEEGQFLGLLSTLEILNALSA
jgi:CBS domain-containing protein